MASHLKLKDLSHFLVSEIPSIEDGVRIQVMKTSVLLMGLCEFSMTSDQVAFQTTSGWKSALPPLYSV